MTAAWLYVAAYLGVGRLMVMLVRNRVPSGVVFSFLLQIVLRYVFNYPVGWTEELSILCWMWGVLWGASFVLKERDFGWFFASRFVNLAGSSMSHVALAFAVLEVTDSASALG